MAIWDKLDKEEESDKDYEEANLALMDLTSLDTKSDWDSKEEDKVFSKQSRSGLILLFKTLWVSGNKNWDTSKFWKINMS